ncbi:hypothetical protein BDP27DRAFT_1415000 [Rhodocollybia butyracea]|uniref:Uncharacterized protein n=1 Tax=Rhodocollybia butyracea TaxID=206335 RepID=A0A9P5Q673_9AGAR|nr:hypothetical protein BDP27DRAFT_1415000 [Rhodocollybia butyracea]
MFKLFLILLSPLMVSAHPINVLSTSSSTTALAALLAVILSLVILFVIKVLYMRYRRTHVAYNFSDSSLRSSSSFFYNSEKFTKPGRAAFFVGLFGSPSWETGVKLANDEPSICSNQLQFQSRYSQRRVSRFSISEFGGLKRSSRFYSVPNTAESRAFSNTLVAASRLAPSYTSSPAYPADIHVNSSTRRHSLPVTRQVSPDNDLNDRKRRHSSLKSSTSRHANSVALSPKNHTSFIDFELSSPNSSLTHARSRSRSSRSYVPPLPSLPASVLLSPLPDISNSISSPEGRSYISYPYALSPTIKQNDTDVCVEAGLDMAPTSHRLSPTSAIVLRTKSKPTRSPSVRSRKSPPVGPSPLRNMTLPTVSVKANLNNFVAHSGNSHPPTELTTDRQVLSENEKKHNYFNLGIGYPSSWGIGLGLESSQVPATMTELSRSGSHRQVSQPSSSGFVSHRTTSVSVVTAESSPKTPESDDTDAMLGIIQELIEETSRWDDSLFMDNSFKALIENSRSISSSGSALALSSSKASPKDSQALEELTSAAGTPNPAGSSDSARSPVNLRTRSTSPGAARVASDSRSIISTNSAHSQTQAHSKSLSVDSRNSPSSCKLSPKSILKKNGLVPLHSVEFELGLVELDTVRMESFRLSAYETYGEYDYDTTMPGAYEHGMVLTPLPESNEEVDEWASTGARTKVGVKPQSTAVC